MEERIEHLKNLDFDTLCQIPSQSEIYRNSNKILMLWHDTVEGGWHRFVLQETTQKLYGMLGKVRVYGFLINEFGSIKDLKQNELYDFF